MYQGPTTGQGEDAQPQQQLHGGLHAQAWRGGLV